MYTYEVPTQGQISLKKKKHMEAKQGSGCIKCPLYGHAIYKGSALELLAKSEASALGGGQRSADRIHDAERRESEMNSLRKVSV